MAYKSGYEPKDARTISTYEDDDDFDDFDNWSLIQHLDELRNDPEEFKKAPPPPATTTKKTTTPFFLRKKNKNKSSNGNSSSKSSESSTYNALPNIIHRKNYIEIIPHTGSRLPHFYEPMSGNIPALATGSKPSLNEPVLPSRRDSSLYAASIRSLSIKSPSKAQHNNNNNNSNNNNSNNNNNNNSHHHHHHQHHPTVSRSNSTKTSNSGNYHHYPLQRTASSEINTYPSKTIVSPPSPNLKTVLSSSANSSQTSLILKEREKNKKMVDAMITAYEGMDVIEAGLIQRLKQCELADEKIPSDAVSTVLAEEHIRALKVSANAERLYQQQLLDLQQYQQSQLQLDQQQLKNKKKIRHVQVQTLPWNEKENSSSLSLSLSSEKIDKNTTSVNASTNTINDQQQELPSLSPSTSSTSTTTTNQHPLNETNPNESENQQENTNNEPESIEELKRQLLQERQERQRLEASLQVTCDHFEVLSGLAYKKLRELWEEKIRWENISVELNGRLAAMGKNADGSSMTDGESNSAYFPI
ncbi:unnamed protein product [Cunninghamella blakesleeana]